MKHFHLFHALLLIIALSSCKTTQSVNQTSANRGNATVDAKVLMAAYQQKAAEYRALCYQAYNIAQLRLEQFTKQQTDKPKAIMTDIDETVLDNSPYQVHQTLQGMDYEPESWYEWTARAEADTVPGALRFFQNAAASGIEIFYVTNRDEKERTGTLRNLQKFGFPFADNAHLLLKGNSSSKVPRRDSIAQHFTIIMQVGDNLNDLNGAFEKKSVDERMQVADNFRSEFGYDLIVLPNPSYGEWENALYHYRHDLTQAQKDSIYRVILKNY